MEGLFIPALVIAVAFFGESVFGFGGGLIAIPILGLVLGVHEAVTFVLIFQFCMGLLVFKTYRQIDWGAARPMTGGLVIGTIVGTLLLSLVSGKFLLVFLAVSIIAFLIKSVFFKGFTLGAAQSGLWGTFAGLFGGLFQGFIGSGGPVLTMYLTVATPEKSTMRATLIYLFFFTSVIRLIVSAWQGLFTAELLQLALIAFPFFVVAIILGQLVHAKVSDKYYRFAIYVILSLSAVSLLFKALH